MIRKIQGGRKTNPAKKDPTPKPTIPCRCCHGKGREPLPADYLPTLTALRKFAHGATGEMLCLPMEATARAQQLSRLERWGLVRRIGKQGKAIVWLAAGATAASGMAAAKPALPTVRACLNCGERPEWRRNGNSKRHRLVHSTGTCPNKVVVLDVSDRLVAKNWNETLYRGNAKP